MAPTPAPPDPRAGSGRPGAAGRLLPPLAIAVFALAVGTTLLVAGDTLGYDFRAYHAAAARVLAGQPAYDTSYQAAGGFGLFYYPPTFIPLVLPFALLPQAAAVWAWTALLVAALLGGIALLPVSARVRWAVVLLAAVSWPALYAVKLGQVGPLLLLLFAAGWRWIERPGAAGAWRLPPPVLSRAPTMHPRPRGAPRRGGRVVDRAALEMRSTGNGTGGSNPSLSASPATGDCTPWPERIAPPA